MTLAEFHALINHLSITGLSMDSRTVKPGNLFLALDHNYIDEAVQKGANAVFAAGTPFKKYSLPIITITHLREKIGFFAAEFYQHPSSHLHTIGVTGTNGKTSCTHFIAQAFKLMGKKSAVIGTLGNGITEHIIPSTHTTPDPVLLQQLLANFYHQQAEFIAMEASSHGLAQGRLNGANIETAVFTNLTHDHLDYHLSMENYAQAKFRLFERPELKNAVLNLDDPYGLAWAKTLRTQRPSLAVYGVSLNAAQTENSEMPLISASHIKINPAGLTALIRTPWGDISLNTRLMGKFNLNNLLCAIAVLGIYNMPLAETVAALAQLSPIPGRMQTLGGAAGKPLVIIDYAHTPDALRQTLQAIREHCQGNLWCVFGCGGDRDRSKRPQMGSIAEAFSDHVILTDDNPRHESPAQIIADIREGFTFPQAIIIEHNRQRAIEQAVRSAKAEDIVLIAGKGHETYQEIQHQKIPFSDSMAVKLLLLD